MQYKANAVLTFTEMGCIIEASLWTLLIDLETTNWNRRKVYPKMYHTHLGIGSTNVKCTCLAVKELKLETKWFDPLMFGRTP